MDKKKNKLEKAVGLLKLLAHPVRLSILCNLMHEGEMNVSQIVETEQGLVGQSQISQFLNKMRREGLLKTRKNAQTVYYQLDSSHAELVLKALYKIFCEQ